MHKNGSILERILPGIARQPKFWALAIVPLIALSAILFLSLDNAQTYDLLKVNLNNKSAISSVLQTDLSDASQAGAKTLRVAISSVISPTKTLEHYQELLTHVEEYLGRRVTLILKPTYAEVNDLILGKRVDLGFVCSLAYVKGNDDFGMELLVAPQMNGETVYYSYLIVPQDSHVKGLIDLRNSSFAFTDPLSNSGHLAPTYQLSLLGESPATFFNRYIFTYSHDNSIVAVTDGLVDGAAIDSLIYDQTAASDTDVASKTRIVSRWGPYGIPPVVTSPGLNPELKRELKDFFLNLHHYDKGAEILSKLKIDRFVQIPNSSYDSIREMIVELGW